MTRITDFGRKRTYVEAGFTAQPELDEPVPTPGASSSIPAPITQQVSEAPSGAPPAKKKRKRTPKSKRDNYGKDKLVAETALAASTGEDGADAAAPASEGNEGEKETAEELSKRKLRKKAKTKEWREKMDARKSGTDESHSKSRHNSSNPRVFSKDARTTCLACRQTGHKARDCPSARSSNYGPSAVGICYRCGSRNHSLSRCPEPEDHANPFPHASCFVCNGTGHLASRCPQNAERGIYPNGGCCKLCGKNTHLAKDCDRKMSNMYQARQDMMLTGAGEGRADEDDFHTHRREQVQGNKGPQRRPIPTSYAHGSQQRRVVKF